MILSILFCICFGLLFTAILLVPKMDGKLNAVKMGVMAVMAIFCYLSLTAFVFNKAGVPINLKSDIAALILANVVLWAQIIRKRKVQRMFIRIWDVVCLILLAAFVVYLAYHMFGTELRLSYANTDPGNHFHFAMDIVATQRITSGIYFSAYVDAIFIQLASFALPWILYYKAFIIADVFMHILEIWMFYVLVLTISEKKVVRILAPVFTLVYFWGYPTFSYIIGGFVYWSNGVMILIFMIYALVLLERYPEKMRSIAILLILGLYANSCCNRLFVPINTFAVVAVLAVILWKRKVFYSKKTMAVIAVVGACCLGVVAFVFANYWGGNGIMEIIDRMLAYVSAPHSGFYRALYADTIYFVPPFLLALYYVWKERERYTRIYIVLTFATLLCAVIMFVVWYNGRMSTYYFYKIYYNLWLVGMILAVFALDILADKKQLSVFFSYAAMIVLLVTMSLNCYDDPYAKRDPLYSSYYATAKVMPLYRMNLDYLQKDYMQYFIPDGVLDAAGRVREDEDYGQIPIASADIDVIRWYEGITVQNLYDYMQTYKLSELVGYLDAYGIKKIVAPKNDEMYIDYPEFFQACEVIYENTDALILRNEGESWSSLFERTVDESEEEAEESEEEAAESEEEAAE